MQMGVGGVGQAAHTAPERHDAPDCVLGRRDPGVPGSATHPGAVLSAAGLPAECGALLRSGRLPAVLRRAGRLHAYTPPPPPDRSFS